MKKVLLPFFCVILICLHFSCDDDKDVPEEPVFVENSIKIDGKSISIIGEAKLDLDGQYEDYKHLERMDVDFLLGVSSLVRISFVVEKGNKTPTEGNYVFKGDVANEPMQIFRGWYDDEEGTIYDFESGNCTVTVEGTTYTFVFDFVCKGNNILSGSYKGTLMLVSDEDDDDEEEEIIVPIDNVVTVNGVNYPIVREAELDLDGQYENYVHLERMDVEFVLDEDRISTVCISLVVEKDNQAPVTGHYMFEGRTANAAMRIFRGWYDDENDERYNFQSGSCKVEVEDDIYTFLFDFVCEDGKVITGNYQGILNLISEDDDDDEEEIITPVKNVITVDGVEYPITKEAELDLDGQYKHYEHLERMDVEFMFGEGQWPHVGISPIVEMGNHTPVAGYYTFEGESADSAWQMFRAWYTDENDERYLFISGNCTIEVDIDIYTFVFEFICEDGKVITGSYQGRLKLISGGD